MDPKFLPILLLVNFASSKADWCYTEAPCGPSTWTSLGSCNGSRQSPIDIPEDSVLFNQRLSQIVFTNYSKKGVFRNVSNTGHTVEISLGDGVWVAGGGLPSTYSAIAFHFHWGNGSLGSEHRLSGRQYPMEMHIVHTKGGMNLSEAKKDPIGVAVFGFFIDVMDSANTSQLVMVSDLLEEVANPGTTMPLNLSQSLDDLLGDVNLTMYYRYNGSLTTPTCDEIVLWTIFKNPITVPSKVVTAFASAIKHNISANVETMQNNFRPVQPLNGRRVQASFPSVMALSPNSTATSNEGSVLSAALVVSMILMLLHTRC
ncbi:carbonic anhydrase 4-like isoform X2 [Engystomops pustulosus]|uniref:carbonic anhydrase 4-like isoform X2 n=1 Tax=Engystomops pustulosus TaxID=76066 RepID=UPI003AFA03B3